MFYLKHIILAVLLLIALFVNGCSSANDEIERFSRHYKEYHDYESLSALFPYFYIPMARSEVEELLGEPSYCPSTSECYYHTDKSIFVCPTDSIYQQGTCLSDLLGEVSPSNTPWTLIVRYAATDSADYLPGDIVRGFFFLPVGE